MNIIQELHKRGITWNIGPAVAKAHATSLTEKLCRQVTVTFPEGEPVTKNFVAYAGDPTVQSLLVQTIRGDERVADLMRAWFDTHGNVPVAMVDRLIEDQMIPELMHVALRKLADSKQSSINWNALHQFRSEDRIAFWTMVEKVLVDSFKSREGKKPPTRRQVAIELRQGVLDHFSAMSYSHFENASGRRVERESSERFALIAFHCACELTEMSEWMWAWLGYALKDLEREGDEPLDDEATS